MSQILIPLALLAAWAVTAWLALGYARWNAQAEYDRGFEDGWKRHVGAVSFDNALTPDYTRGYEAAARDMQRRLDATYDNGRTDGWHECLDALRMNGTRLP